MRREDYLGRECVQSFIEWLRALARGDTPFSHRYRMLRPACNWSCGSLYDAYEGYRWGRADFKTTQETLDCLREEIQAAEKTADNRRFVTAALEVLKWGGVSGGNKERLCALGDGALGKFSAAAELLDPSQADTARLDDVDYMNSGWTKVYSLMHDAFPMYDGRVGAAMGYLVRLWWRKTRPDCTDEETCQVPELLRFRWLAGRGGRHRDPSAKSLSFPRLSYGRHGARTWAECNVWTAWILGALQEEGRFGKLPEAYRLRALESALFMIGYELPRDSHSRGGNPRRAFSATTSVSTSSAPNPNGTPAHRERTDQQAHRPDRRPDPSRAGSLRAPTGAGVGRRLKVGQGSAAPFGEAGHRLRAAVMVLHAAQAQPPAAPGSKSTHWASSRAGTPASRHPQSAQPAAAGGDRVRRCGCGDAGSPRVQGPPRQAFRDRKNPIHGVGGKEGKKHLPHQ